MDLIDQITSGLSVTSNITNSTTDNGASIASASSTTVTSTIKRKRNKPLDDDTDERSSRVYWSNEATMEMLEILLSHIKEKGYPTSLKSSISLKDKPIPAAWAEIGEKVTKLDIGNKGLSKEEKGIACYRRYDNLKKCCKSLFESIKSNLQNITKECAKIDAQQMNIDTDQFQDYVTKKAKYYTDNYIITIGDICELTGDALSIEENDNFLSYLPHWINTHYRSKNGYFLYATANPLLIQIHEGRYKQKRQKKDHITESITVVDKRVSEIDERAAAIREESTVVRRAQATKRNNVNAIQESSKYFIESLDKLHRIAQQVSIKCFHEKHQDFDKLMTLIHPTDEEIELMKENGIVSVCDFERLQPQYLKNILSDATFARFVICTARTTLEEQYKNIIDNDE
jgi:hypothetical protein